MTMTFVNKPITIEPTSLTTNPDGHYAIGGVSVTELVHQYGSPLYVMDDATLRSNCQSYTNPLQTVYPNHLVVYAGKACLTVGLLNLLSEEGLGVDVVSAGELYTALKSNIPQPNILFHGNNKSREELEMALKHSIRIIVDNEQELDSLIELTQAYQLRARIMLRTKPEIEAHTHDYIKTGQIDSKFGIEKSDLLRCVRKVKDNPLIHILGLHSHIGSQIFDIEPYIDLATIMAEHTVRLSEELGRPIEEINLGGGIGIKYTHSDDPPLVSDVIVAMAKQLVHEFTSRGMKLPKLIVEPGRSIVGNAGVTLYTVGGIKEIPGVKTYLFIDGGMSDNIRPMLYQSQYTFDIATKAKQPAIQTYAIAGKFCESGDVLTHNVSLPHAEVGDIMIVFDTGAYNYSMSSNYNRAPRPAMVTVSNGKSHVWVKRETLDDLIRNDCY
ncbi:diaminopimelate decarboxylase [bacterium]|nr:diaminopimelate decarboxylase [bacterium]